MREIFGPQSGKVKLAGGYAGALAALLIKVKDVRISPK
jgi:hypothetical protein